MVGVYSAKLALISDLKSERRLSIRFYTTIETTVEDRVLRDNTR